MLATAVHALERSRRPPSMRIGPFAFTDPGREVAMINPFDPAHDNGTLLVNARSGGGETLLVNVLLSRFLAHGMQAFVLDRAGHYGFLCQLVPRRPAPDDRAGEDSYDVDALKRNPLDVGCRGPPGIARCTSGAVAEVGEAFGQEVRGSGSPGRKQRCAVDGEEL